MAAKSYFLSSFLNRVVRRDPDGTVRHHLLMGPGSIHIADPENARLDVLRSYAILDTEPEPEYVELVQRIARVWPVPVAMLTFLDSARCWIFVTVGVEPGSTSRDVPRHESLCNYACQSSGTLVVTDAQADPRFAQLPMVSQPGGYRFYAGCPLITPEGHSIGTLCVLDRAPREPTTAQLNSLRQHTAEAMALLDRRRERLTATPPTDVSPGAARRTVLVVDDDEHIRIFVREILNHLGIASLEAANGAEALAQYRAHASNVGLVLTDINMPVMSGLDLVRALHREAGAPAIAVMSGRLDFTLKDTLAAEGVTCLLAKPFTIASLTKAVALLPA